MCEVSVLGWFAMFWTVGVMPGAKNSCAMRTFQDFSNATGELTQREPSAKAPIKILLTDNYEDHHAGKNEQNRHGK